MTKFARLDRLPPYVFATVNQIKMDARRNGEDNMRINQAVRGIRKIM
ncbi:MAG: hypothetical protein ABFS43_11980 [Thermodesulfobacteriota bacterium]